jgi:uncharacterized protein
MRATQSEPGDGMRHNADNATSGMRRADRQITDRAQIDQIIRQSRVCRLGLVCDGGPYVVPLCFGYDGDAVYLHMATEGKKLDALRANPRVCLEWDLPGDVLPAPQACGWGMTYWSVIAYGMASELTDDADKRHALALIMEQYTGEERAWSFPPEQLARTVVVRVQLVDVTGKARG